MPVTKVAIVAIALIAADQAMAWLISMLATPSTR
jgi:hypothetical protein